MAKPECNCGTLYEDTDGNKIHYLECAVVQDALMEG